MKTSLYRHYSADDKLLYVGVSISAVHRLGQHAEHSDWYNSITRVTIERFETREAALQAERAAIIKERPAHNIQHQNAAKAAAKKAQEQEGQILLDAARAKKDLTARVAHFHPVYSLHEAADALSVHVGLVTKWVRQGKIGHFTMPNRNDKPIAYISGWQLIEYIESMMSAS